MRTQPRMAELLSEAAASFEAGEDPFATSWLIEHGVTLDECGELSANISLIIKGFLSLPAEQKAEILFRGATAGVISPEMLGHVLALKELREGTERLKAFRGNQQDE